MKIAIGSNHLRKDIKLNELKFIVIMDYEKKYKEALQRAKHALDYDNHGKWDEDKDTARDLMMADEEPKCPFKPFDRVLVRDEVEDDCCWVCALFSHYDPDDEDEWFYFVCLNGNKSHMCVPYNEETAHLIGTTDAPPEKYVIW